MIGAFSPSTRQRYVSRLHKKSPAVGRPLKPAR